MDLDDVEQALTGSEVTGAEAAVAAGLVLLGLACYFVLGRLLRRFVKRRTERVLPVEASNLLIRVTQIVVLVVFLGWALSAIGANIGWLSVVVLIVLAIAVLVARPFLDGLAASNAVTTRGAFSVGDEIEVGGVAGCVVEITNRSTVMRARDGRRLHIPNKELLDRTVVVFTADTERRSIIDLAVAQCSDLDQVDCVVRDTLDRVGEVSRLGSVRARSLGDEIELAVGIWHGPTLAEGNDAVDAAIRSLKAAFEQEDIELASPSMVVRLDDRTNAREL